MVKVIAKQAFIHDSHNLSRGDEAEVSAVLAQELAAIGLVELKSMAAPQNKMVPPAQNKRKGK